MGRRLGELTKENTKCMVPVNGVRLIDRLLGQLSQLSLNRIIIVVGYKGKELRDYIESSYLSPLTSHHSPLNIEFAENPIYDKTNNIYSLSIVKDRLQEDDTLLIESDLIFSDRLFPMLLDNPYPNLALVAKYESWMDGTMVRLDEDQNIVNFVSKEAFDYADVDSYYKTVNIYKLSREFLQHQYVPFLDAYTKAVGNNEYYENVLRIISMLNSHNMKALPIGNERWYEIDDKQDLDIAEAIFADDQDVLRKYYGRYGGFWRFPQMLDFCYLVNPYFPSKRMKDELRSNFDTLLTEYPSGMKVNTLIASKCFGVSEPYIVPGNGAAELIKVLMESLSNLSPLTSHHSPLKIGFIRPTFEEYPNRYDKDSQVTFVPQNEDYRYTADDLMAYFGEHKVDTLIVINPDWDAERPFESTREIYQRIVRRCAGKCRVYFPVSAYDFCRKGVPSYCKATGKSFADVAETLTRMALEVGGNGLTLECVDYNHYPAPARQRLREVVARIRATASSPASR